MNRKQRKRKYEKAKRHQREYGYSDPTRRYRIRAKQPKKPKES
jgi:hypothetical protein